MTANTLIRIIRPLEPDVPVSGYVVGMGLRWFLMLIVCDRIKYDGFEVFRFSDVSEICIPEPTAKFMEAALRKRRLQRPKTPRILLTGINDIIKSASKHFPLIAIHCELSDPDVCSIGYPVEVSRKMVLLHTISPDAEWNSESDGVRLSEITRVNFGGAYEEALALVGGAISHN